MSLHAVKAAAQVDADGNQSADRPLQFEVIPNVCTLADACRILQLSERQFHYLTARKELALVELRRVDRRRRFTGESVARQIKVWAAKRTA